MDYLYIQGTKELLSDYYWECPLTKMELLILADKMLSDSQKSEFEIIENILKENKVA